MIRLYSMNDGIMIFSILLLYVSECIRPYLCSTAISEWKFEFLYLIQDLLFILCCWNRWIWRSESEGSTCLYLCNLSCSYCEITIQHHWFPTKVSLYWIYRYTELHRDEMEGFHYMYLLHQALNFTLYCIEN